jgi:3-hydroxy acid dehydrogenase/malonic semialdehyde reductase
MAQKIALITGASSGFGKACAQLFAKNGYDLILTGRRTERLNELASDLESNYFTNIKSLSFDVRDLNSTERALHAIPEDWKKNITVLVNNAGLAAGRGPIHEGNIDDWEQMIDTNVKGLLYVTRIVSPWMVAQKQGHIINIGSIAGKETYPGGNVYCATKFAVDALSKSMRIDLIETGVKVTNIAPGAAETEFSLVRFKGDADAAKKVYEGLIPLSADDIAEAVYFAASRPGHVNINDIVIVPAAQANATVFDRSK